MRIKLFFTIGIMLLLVGCASTTSMVVDPGSRVPQYDSAYVVKHGGNSSDMDDALTTALLKQHLNVKSGNKAPVSSMQQYIVTYSDHWYWDLVMYLKAVSISIKNGTNHNIIAQGSWENSFLHSYPDVNEVMENLVHKLFQKIRLKSAESDN